MQLLLLKMKTLKRPYPLRWQIMALLLEQKRQEQAQEQEQEQEQGFGKWSGRLMKLERRQHQKVLLQDAVVVASSSHGQYRRGRGRPSSQLEGQGTDRLVC